jgi:cold shock CspA family protein
MIGRVLKYDKGRHYGFLHSLWSKKDYFFHKTDCLTPPESLIRGQLVTFYVDEKEEKIKAVSVDRLKPIINKVNNNKMNGKIRVWKEDKAYGFIDADDGQQYFFHLKDILCSTFGFERGVEVTFKTAFAPDGRTKAVQVDLLCADC